MSSTLTPSAAPAAGKKSAAAPAPAPSARVPAMAGFNGGRRVPAAVNEPIKSYAPGSPEKADLKARLASMAGETVDIGIVITARSSAPATRPR